MNKITKSLKEFKDTKQLRSAPPSACPTCGFTVDQMQEDYDMPWMVFGQPGSTMIFYQCPHCNSLAGNIHAIANTKIIMEDAQKGQRILTPMKKIILPGKN